jgi:hypothetical protein
MNTFFEQIGLITGLIAWHESGWRDRRAVAPFIASLTCAGFGARSPQGGPVQAA